MALHSLTYCNHLDGYSAKCYPILLDTLFLYRCKQLSGQEESKNQGPIHLNACVRECIQNCCCFYKILRTLVHFKIHFMTVKNLNVIFNAV